MLDFWGVKQEVNADMQTFQAFLQTWVGGPNPATSCKVLSHTYLSSAKSIIELLGMELVSNPPTSHEIVVIYNRIHLQNHQLIQD